MNSVREIFSYETFYDLYVQSKAQQEKIKVLEEASASQAETLEKRMTELHAELDALRNLIRSK